MLQKIYGKDTLYSGYCYTGYNVTEDTGTRDTLFQIILLQRIHFLQEGYSVTEDTMLQEGYKVTEDTMLQEGYNVTRMRYKKIQC